MNEIAPVEGAPGLATAGGAPSLVRAARASDVPEILALVCELAEYERARDEVLATEADLAALLFGANTPSGAPAAYCHVIEADPDSGRLAGFALWFLNASTWLGRHGVYLEDLFVRPEFRGRGYGQALMAELAALCVERGYGRLEWWVLDWNTDAIGFYDSLGARPMDEWTVHRLTGSALTGLAAGAISPGVDDRPPRP